LPGCDASTTLDIREVDGVTTRLRLLIVDGPSKRRDDVARTVTVLGHEIVGREASLETVGAVTAAELPDVAMVIVGEHSDESLQLVRTIVREAACPVIAILDERDPGFVDEAARLGIFAYIAHRDDLAELQSSIDIALQRFAEYHALEGAFGRRAITERAKGILMERHSLDEMQAFQMLRDHARRSNRKIVELAEALVASHRLLPGGASPSEANVEMPARTDEEP
jgi:AmiR/NasT family two-component response regulator